MTQKARVKALEARTPQGDTIKAIVRRIVKPNEDGGPPIEVGQITRQIGNKNGAKSDESSRNETGTRV